MIQFRRGTTKSWRATKVKLSSGQPGYDKDKHKIKIGDGNNSWVDLPYASGLFAKEILDSEVSAKARKKLDNEDDTLITYGTAAPDNSTVGQLYLQQSNTDYLVESGISNGWIYKIYSSGIMSCCGTFKVNLDLTDSLEGTGLYCDSSNFKKEYPKAFKNPPAELASIQSSNGMAWLANKGINTTTSSGSYTVISTASATNTEYIISIQAEGLKQ
jgi:hypothetical protein